MSWQLAIVDDCLILDELSKVAEPGAQHETDAG
jgi:hypothetical protein